MHLADFVDRDDNNNADTQQPTSKERQTNDHNGSTGEQFRAISPARCGSTETSTCDMCTRYCTTTDQPNNLSSSSARRQQRRRERQRRRLSDGAAAAANNNQMAAGYCSAIPAALAAAGQRDSVSVGSRTINERTINE